MTHWNKLPRNWEISTLGGIQNWMVEQVAHSCKQAYFVQDTWTNSYNFKYYMVLQRRKNLHIIYFSKYRQIYYFLMAFHLIAFQPD